MLKELECSSFSGLLWAPKLRQKNLIISPREFILDITDRLGGTAVVGRPGDRIGHLELSRIHSTISDNRNQNIKSGLRVHFKQCSRMFTYVRSYKESSLTQKVNFWR